MPRSFSIEGDPQVYTLTFDFNQICEAEKETGINLLKPLAGAGISATETRALLYALLKPAHPLVLLAEAGELLNKDLPTVLSELGAMLKAAQQEQAAEDPE
jgi:hypothetical protein